MIIVNLLPHELRPVKRTPLPYLLCMILVAVAVLLIAGTFLRTQGEIMRQQRLKAARVADFDEPTDIVDENGEEITLRGVVDAFNRLSERKDSLEERITVIKEILSDRIIWSEQIHRLTELTPKNIWYERVRVVWQDFKERVVKRDPKTGEPILDQRTNKPQTETKTVKRPVFEVSGYVINDEQGQALISPLTRETTRDEAFTKYFRLMRPQLEDTEYDGYAVRHFVLGYQIEMGGGS